jgi:hypothetical protein
VSKKHPRKEKAILTAEICRFYVKNIFPKKNPGKIEQQQEKKSKLFKSEKIRNLF